MAATCAPTIARPSKRILDSNPPTFEFLIARPIRHHPAGPDFIMEKTPPSEAGQVTGERYVVRAIPACDHACDDMTFFGGSRVEMMSHSTPMAARDCISRQKNAWVCPGNSG